MVHRYTLTEEGDDVAAVMEQLEAIERSTDPRVFVTALADLVRDRIESERWSDPTVETFNQLVADASAVQDALFVSHDIRSHVGVLSSLVHVCREELTSLLTVHPHGSPEGARIVANLQRDFADMNAAVSNIAAISREAPGGRPRARSRRPTALTDVLETTTRMMSRIAPVSLESTPARDVYVRSPQADLSRVLNNLIRNAAEAIRGRAAGRVELRAWASSTVAFVEVTDNGPGLDVSQPETVFDLFHTTKPTGQGIGLAACRKLTQRWGGTIEVDSRPPEGTTFRISIPVV